MIKRAFSVIIFCLPEILFAQVPGDPTFNTNFETYGEAINKIIDTGADQIGCPGLLVGFGPTTNPVGTGYFQLSADLRRQCDKLNNFTTGATLSGGFSDPFSTRTFLPFTINAPRPTKSLNNLKTNEASRNRLNFLHFSDSTDRIQHSFDSEEFSISTNIEVTKLRISDSNFAVGQDGYAYQASINLVKRPVGGRSFGVGMFVNHRETRAFRNVLFADTAFPGGRDAGDLDLTLAGVRSFCSNLERGENKSSGIGLSAFYQQLISNTTSLAFEAGLSQSRKRYSFPICMFRVGNNPGEDVLFAGRINGRPKELSYYISSRIEKIVPLAGGLFIPRLSLTARRIQYSQFVERETGVPSGSSVSIFDFGTVSQLGAVPTGAALIYDSRTSTSLVSQLGATVVWPVRVQNGTGSLWFDVAYLHEFGDPNRLVSARFAGDFRAVPTRFTFKTNPIDRDVYRVGAGFELSGKRGSVVSLGTSVLLGDDLERSYSVSALYRWDF